MSILEEDDRASLMDDTDRTKRVKEARDEAKKEIDAYRKQKDEEFKKFEAEVWSSCTKMPVDFYHIASRLMEVRPTDDLDSTRAETRRPRRMQTRTRRHR